MSNISATSKRVLGQAAESLACEIYAKAGFEILERNFRAGRYEVDVIACRANIIHLVEVKFRQNMLDASFCLSQAQFQRIAQAGEIYLQDRTEFMQIDAFLVDRKLQWKRIANIMLE